MKLSFEDIEKDLEEVKEQIISSRLDIGTIGYIGKVDERLGLFFSNSFDCEKINLPSLKRKGKNNTLTKIVNEIYPYLPEEILKVLSYQYKKIYNSSERIFPSNVDWSNLGSDNSDILLVDDNIFTGRTMEIWKENISKMTGRKAYTFSITVTGEYLPDYFCYEGWRSFEWRPIGI